MSKKQKGFTLIEIAIVLLIIGLLLGGVVKGQSMIDSARVRSIANDLSGIETAWISFQDRYRSLPGDFSSASTHIDGDATNGNASAIVDSDEESGAVWQHLASAGFIAGEYAGGAVNTAVATACVGENICPSNPFNGSYKIGNTSHAIGGSTSLHELMTGGNIPVDVMYELDLKIDDGKPNGGRLQAFDDTCVDGDDWNVIAGSADCAAVLALP